MLFNGFMGVSRIRLWVRLHGGMPEMVVGSATNLPILINGEQEYALAA
jgi:hypothetical protein